MQQKYSQTFGQYCIINMHAKQKICVITKTVRNYSR